MFTLNEKYLDDYKAKFLSRYRARWLEDKSRFDDRTRLLREIQSGGSEHASAFQSAQASLSQLGFHVEDEMDLNKLGEKDAYEDALDIMALARAYFHGTCHTLIFFCQTCF